MTDDLGPRIDLVVDMMAQMAVARDTSPVLPQERPTSTTYTPPTNIDILVDSTKQVVVEANEAISRSEASSVYRNNMKPQTRARIDEWIELYESEVGYRAVDTSSTTSDSRWTPDTTEAGSSARTVVDKRLGLEDDSDDEFELEELEACLRVAEDAFESEKIDNAEKFFEKAALLRKSLSPRIQSVLPIKDIYLKLAWCYFFQGKTKESEECLHQVRNGPTALDKDAIRYLHATQLLAEIYLFSNNFDGASMECRKALKGRKRIHGKDAPEYFEALGLLSAIMKAKGDHVTAETYNAMIPEKDRTFQPFKVPTLHQNVETYAKIFDPRFSTGQQNRELLYSLRGYQ